MATPFYERIYLEIRSKSRADWKALLHERWTDLRIWIQENGEKAAILCLVVGFFLAMEYTLVFWLLVLFGVLSGVIWYFASPGGSDRGDDASNTLGSGPH